MILINRYMNGGNEPLTLHSSEFGAVTPKSAQETPFVLPTSSSLVCRSAQRFHRGPDQTECFNVSNRIFVDTTPRGRATASTELEVIEHMNHAGCNDTGKLVYEWHSLTLHFSEFSASCLSDA